MEQQAIQRLPLSILSSRCSLADHIEDETGVGQHGNVTAGGLDGGGAHALRYEALQIGVYGAVLGGHDVQARLRPPSTCSAGSARSHRHRAGSDVNEAGNAGIGTSGGDESTAKECPTRIAGL